MCGLRVYVGHYGIYLAFIPETDPKMTDYDIIGGSD